MTSTPRPGTRAGAEYALAEKQAAAQRQARRDARPRPISKIADEIMSKWATPYFGAVPYINAMFALDRITDKYDREPGDEIVLRFLSNAGTWHGPDARRIKAELKAML